MGLHTRLLELNRARHGRHSLWVRGKAALGSVVVGALVVPAALATGVAFSFPAFAASEVPDIAVQVRIGADGTESWDADDSAGNDSGPNNGIVRVNDTVRYEVEYVVSSSEAKNLTWSVTFPKGMELTVIPGYCSTTSGPRPGTSLVPETAGTPTIPLTASSIDELSAQTLTCNMGDRTASTDKVSVSAKVLNVAHQGQDLPLLAASITADGVETPVPAKTPLPSVAASGRLMWDISKNNTALTENTGSLMSETHPEACSWDQDLVCFVTHYPVQVGARDGGKGTALPAVGGITFVDDVTPAAMYPTLSASDVAAINADLDSYGSKVSVGRINANNYRAPYSKVGEVPAATATNSVRDGGKITVSQPSRGTPAEINISDADWSLRSSPTENAYGQAIPSGTVLAASFMVIVETPAAVVQDFGLKAGNTWTLSTWNEYTDLSIDGFDPGDHQTSAGQPGPESTQYPGVHWNDYRTSTPKVEVPGTFRKNFIGVPNASDNVAPAEFNPVWAVYEGPPGSEGGHNSGGITVAPTQNIISNLVVSGSNISFPTKTSNVVCDAWDNSSLYLRKANYEGSNVAAARAQWVPSGGEAVWVSGYNNVPWTASQTQLATKATETPTLTVQYSATPGGSGAASACGDDQGPWYENPADVPGNDATLAAQGVYTAVSRVRAHLVLPEPAAPYVPASSGVVMAWISIGLQVADTTDPAGTVIPNWASSKRVVGEDLSMSEVLAAPGSFGLSTYDPATHAGNVGDRLILAPAQARVNKQVRKGDSGSFSDTPPQVTGGDLVQYRLSPSLTSGAATPGVRRDVWVEDCLPASQAYDTASVTPAVVAVGSTPADAKRAACAAGETYIRWVFPGHEVNTTISPILLSVEVSTTADDGVYTNTVVVWAQDDQSTVAQRTDSAQIQIANVAGIRLEKTALTPVVQVNREGQAAKEENRWLVKLTNTLPSSELSGVTDADVIDVLPKRGADGTEFDGAFTFKSATVTQGGSQTRVLYTKTQNVSLNPRNSSNAAAGSTTWCDAADGGSVVSGSTANGCPAGVSEVTAVRVQRPGVFQSGEVIAVEIAMVAVENSAGDVYVNSAMAAVQGLDDPVGPLRRSETVISSSVGDYVWWDFNRNGIQDIWQGEAEQPAAGVTVKLTGTDDLGNAVNLETRTGANGKYLFDGLRGISSEGDARYTVSFVAPEGATFTLQHATTGTPPVNDPAKDSDADPETGAAPELLLGRNTKDVTIDAGLLKDGSLAITKVLRGAGVAAFATKDSYTFTVRCEFEGERVGPVGEDDPETGEPQDATVTLNYAGEGVAITSAPLTGIPVYSDCTVKEITEGNADEAAQPVTVQIPWDPATQSTTQVIASQTNYYSAGTVRLQKKTVGSPSAVEFMKNKAYGVLVTCQIEEEGEDGPVRVTLYSGTVLIKAGQTKELRGLDGEPQVLPLGARCFGAETDDGGASSHTVNFTDWQNAAIVTAGTPEKLQTLSIEVTNTFSDECALGLCPSPSPSSPEPTAPASNTPEPLTPEPSGSSSSDLADTSAMNPTSLLLPGAALLCLGAAILIALVALARKKETE